MKIIWHDSVGVTPGNTGSGDYVAGFGLGRLYDGSITSGNGMAVTAELS